MEQNKELRFLVDTMLKTYDQLNKQIAEELSAGTPIPAKEIMGQTSKERLEYFNKESDYDEVNNQFVYLFETRGFANRILEAAGSRELRMALDSLYIDFLNTFSDDELLELIEKTREDISELRYWTVKRLENKTEDLNCKKSA